MHAPIRICQLTPCLWSGGTEERIARLSAGLDRGEFSTHWIGFGPIREALLDKAGGANATPIERNPARGIQASVILRLARVLRRRQPDVLHVHNWSTSLYGIAAARIAGVPKIVFGMGGQDSTEPPPARRQALMRSLTPHIDRFTAVCGYLGRDLADYWGAPADRLTVLKTGIDVDAHKRDGALAEELRAQLGIPASAPVIGAISVLRPVKRIQDLIAAAGALQQAHPQLHLVLVGNALGVSMEALRRQAQELGIGERLHLLGRVEQPQRYLSAFDVFVNCSDFEGASNAILEAMAARVPVVATEVGGTPELIRDDQTGLLVPPRAPPALASAIDRLLIEPELRGRLTAAARATVVAEHAYPAMIQAYASLYRQLAREEPSTRRLGALLQSVLTLAKA